jgi:hypothetical protein
MKNGRLPFAVTLFVLLFCLAAPGRAEIVYLDANFNDKTLDAPIGKNGAAAGEPFYVDTWAGGYVRSAPMATPSLEVVDGSEYAGSVWFKLLNSARVNHGVLVTTAKLWIAEPAGMMAPCRVSFTESGATSFSFLWLNFNANGLIHLTDADGPVGYIGTYVPGTVLELRVVIDLDDHTFDVELNGQLLRDDEPFSGGDVGVNRVAFSFEPDADLIGTFYLDDLRVSDPDSVPVQPCTWGRLLRMFAP